MEAWSWRLRIAAGRQGFVGAAAVELEEAQRMPPATLQLRRQRGMFGMRPLDANQFDNTCLSGFEKLSREWARRRRRSMLR